MKFQTKYWTTAITILSIWSSTAFGDGTRPRCKDYQLNTSQGKAFVLKLEECGILHALNLRVNPEPREGEIERMVETEVQTYISDKTYPLIYRWISVDKVEVWNPTDPMFRGGCEEVKTHYSDYSDQWVKSNICPAGCLTGQEKILFTDGYTSVKEAVDSQRSSVVTISDTSVFSSLEFENKTIEMKTKDGEEIVQDIYFVTTADGGKIQMTSEHPMLNGEGMVVQARSLSVGDQLVRANGNATAITGIYVESKMTRTYNIQAASDNELGHLYIAEGFVSGDLWFQNEGLSQQRRVLLRRNGIPTAFQD